MIVRPGDRCECSFPDGGVRKCTVLRGPLPPSKSEPGVLPSLSPWPYRYEVRFDNGETAMVGEPRLTRVGETERDPPETME